MAKTYEGKPCSKGHTTKYVSGGTCVECQRERNRIYAANNKQRARQWHKNDYAQNAELHIWKAAKRRAKKLQLPFNITPDDIVPPTQCPVLGIPLVRANGRRGHNPNSPSIDRIIPELGYTPDNIVVISSKANVIKNDATPSQLRKVADWLESVYPKDYEWLDD